jgi:hypothetical protein
LTLRPWGGLEILVGEGCVETQVGHGGSLVGITVFQIGHELMASCLLGLTTEKRGQLIGLDLRHPAFFGANALEVPSGVTSTRYRTLTSHCAQSFRVVSVPPSDER